MHLSPQGIPPFPSKKPSKWSSISAVDSLIRSSSWFTWILKKKWCPKHSCVEHRRVQQLYSVFWRWYALYRWIHHLFIFIGNLMNHPFPSAFFTERFGASVTGFVASHRLLPALVSLSWFVSVGRRTRGSTRCSLYLVCVMDLALRCLQRIWVIAIE